jgi:hypothetical protein
VPHAHPLHVDLEAECYCCRAMQPFRFASPNDQVVCAFCTKHQGSDKAERRDRDHVAMWAEFFADERAAHTADAEQARTDAAAAAAEIAARDAQVAELSAGIVGAFDASAEGGMRAKLEGDLVKRAERRTVLADRRLDALYGLLWRLDAMHQGDPARAGYCTCGRTLLACTEGRALDQERSAIETWAAKNVALLQAGERHALPDEHPAVRAATPPARR